MVRLKIWQWGVLALPLVGVISFLIIAAGSQIHRWGLSWLWAVIAVLFLGWRFLLVRWLQLPAIEAAEAALADFSTTLPPPAATHSPQRQQAESAVQRCLVEARADGPPWEDWPRFFQRCQTLVEAIAQVYSPTVKRPLLHIYVPQAYGLIRGTVDDVDRWMQKLSPVLGQVSIGQAYEAYETYQKLEPAARWAMKAWSWAQWILNPAVAIARTTTQGYTKQANQDLLLNLGQMMREATLKALGEQAIALYSGSTSAPIQVIEQPASQQSVASLRDILAQASESATEPLNPKPLNVLLLGRTGAGKSSLINTLFSQTLAQVDVLPSTDQLQSYRFATPEGDTLNIWDAPGYEQIGADYQQQVMAQAHQSDIILLVTPATDPTLQMDLEPLQALQAASHRPPILAVITQVDRLRPLREWQPPYDWRQGDRPKERNIRAALAYRNELLNPYCEAIFPLVTSDPTQNRTAWGLTELSQAIVAAITPAQELRLARFLEDLETRTQAATRIIDRYVFQMSTIQGLTALVKSPLLQFLSTLLTGSPALAIVLAEKLPLEQSPVVLGKLQMAYDLHCLLRPDQSFLKLDLLTLWPLLVAHTQPVPQEAWALGQTLVSYWTAQTPVYDLQTQYETFLKKSLSLS